MIGAFIVAHLRALSIRRCLTAAKGTGFHFSMEIPGYLSGLL